MGIGNYKQIKIVRYDPFKNGSGDNTETPTQVYLGYAEVTEVSGSRRFSDMPLNTKVLRFNIRNRPAIIPKIEDVILYDGRKHTVQNVQKAGEKRFKYEITGISI